MDNENNNVNVEKEMKDLEEKSLEVLDTLHEQGNQENEKTINDSKSKIEDILQDAKEKVKEFTDSKEVKEFLETIKEQVSNIVESTKEKAIELSENEQFKSAILSGKEFVSSTTGLIVDGISTGIEKMKENEDIKKVFEKTEEAIDNVRSSDALKDTVDKAEEIADKVNKFVFEGLKKILKDKEDR